MKKFILIIIFFYSFSYTQNIPIDLKSSSIKNIEFKSYDELIVQTIENTDIKKVEFIGNVNLTLENLNIKAKRVLITGLSNKMFDISAFEDVEIRDNNTIYLAEEISFNPDTRRGVLKKVRYFTEGSSSATFGTTGIFYNAEKVTMIDEKKLYLENAIITFSPKDQPPYQFFVKEGWYYRDLIIFAHQNDYRVGTFDFFYLPYFFIWEKYTTILTALGQEKKIGWYLMNTFNLNLPGSSYVFNLDLYETLGQYFFMQYRTSPNLINGLKSLNLDLKLANDNKVIYDSQNDRYTKTILVNGVYTNISTFSAYYKISGSMGYNNTLISFYWEDLNDPFFLGKFDTRKTRFDLKEVFQPEENKFYSREDRFPTTQSLTRGFSINYGIINLNGNYIFNRIYEGPDNNIYDISKYKYILSQISFPNISINLPGLTIINTNIILPLYRILTINNSNITLNYNQDINKYITEETNFKIKYNISSIETNFINTNLIMTNKNEIIEISTNLVRYLTNFSEDYTVETNITKTKYSIKDIKLVIVSLSSSLNSSISINSIRTVDSNLNVINDDNKHTESGSMNLNFAFFDSLISFNNSFSFFNRKQWTSINNPALIINYYDFSGYEINLNSSLSSSRNFQLFQNNFYQIDIPIGISFNCNYPLLKTTYMSTIRYLNFSGSFNTGIKFFRDTLSFNASTGYSSKYRLTNITSDEFIDNKLEERFNISAGAKFLWLSASSGVNFDILEKKKLSISNNITNYIIPERQSIFDYEYLKKRMVNNPILNLSLSFPQELRPLPSISYSYDLIKMSNINLSLSSSYSIGETYIPLIYRIENINFNASLNWDFLFPKNTVFNLNFSTSMLLDKYWRLVFNTSVRNNNIYRYIKEYSQLYNLPLVNFWENLYQSLNIFNYSDLRKGYFKIQGFNFSLTHYLDEWEMQLLFNITRRLDNIRKIAYWEPALRIEFTLRGTSEKFPPYEKKFVPPQYENVNY